VKEGLEFVLAYSSESFSPSKLRRLSRRIRVNRTGFEDQCLFDGAFATKWVQPRETLSLAPTGKGKCVCFVSEVERGL
jgi:hypothetical protein